MKENNIKIETYKKEYSNAFDTLNRAWIVRYFGESTIEPFETEILHHPDETIISRGGEVFFATENNQVLGCVALIKHSSEEYEISKLAVDPIAQGRGIANLLFDAVLNHAHSVRAKKLIIESNTKLNAAIGLYHKYNFKKVDNFIPHYQRVDVKFIKEI